ncbi:di-trans,poly-cis-decaprenylcistransferase [Desulfonema ishimotonii]|uniref:Isoprenyl transferase n=1 Tax=Desulfonema ishimotonii TaxID=45657 RepID=A0A401FQQ8_9BACT|nr:isoprenyl transferase [Desulfonema ishimotonii]GBC59299.1 di-trans,poly-cis-decaprenylcistransferase [Desulfonema ishimotonii]
MNSNLPSGKSEGPDPEKIPAHIAMIMDGNGRWARKRLMNRVKGHEQGARVVRDVVRACSDMGVSFLTLYAFSTENWGRAKLEVSALMMILKNFLRSERPDMMANNIRLNAIGQIGRLPEAVRKTLAETMALTANNTGMVLSLALSYGSRAEITEMVREIAGKVRAGEMAPDDITPEVISGHLYTKDMPDPDLLIRTSGEMRISNFLLWQIAYSEIFVTDTLWPDFSKEELLRILQAYQRRDRRFGKIKVSE